MTQAHTHANVRRSGWRTIKFGEVVKNANLTERDPVGAGVERIVGLEHLDPGNLHIRRWNTLGDGTSFSRKFILGQTLFGKRRAYQRKVAFAEFEGICSGDILTFEPKDPETLLPELLPFICQSDAFFDYALGTSAGSLSPRTSWKALQDFEFSLPPIEEQKRIAEILWAADEAVEKFWEAKVRLHELVRVECNQLFTEESNLVTIQELVEQGVLCPPQDGNHGNDHPKAKDYVDSGIPFIMASNLSGHKVDIEECKFIPESVAAKLRIGFSVEGDVLLSHKGTVGEVAIVSALDTPYIMLTPQVTYYRVKDVKILNPKYLFYCFLSDGFQTNLKRFSAQSTRAYVGITAQRKFTVPLPDIETQNRNVERLDQMQIEQERLQKHQEAIKLMSSAFANSLHEDAVLV